MTSSVDETEAKAIITAQSGLEGAMLPILHALQARFGYIDQSLYPALADALNVSKAEVHGVVSFYHDFKTAPRKHRSIKICRAESCQALGVEALIKDINDSSLETVYCLGLCAHGPAALIEGEVIGQLDAQKIKRLLAGDAVQSVAGEG